MRMQRNELKTGLAIVATAFAVAACGGGGDRDEEPPTPMNNAPTLSAIGDQSINQDTTLAALSFGIDDGQTDAGALRVTASSSDETLLPASGIALAGSGPTRTLALTPAESATGAATVTVTVTDPQGLSATRSFRVTVNTVLVSFTGFTIDTFVVSGDEAARSMVGFTLDNDADDSDAVFAALLQ